MFYAYVHSDQNGKPFYVGKGKGKRAWSRRARNKWWKKIVEKRGLQVKFLVKNVDEELAFLCEQEAISVFKMRGEVLCNMTDGGEGSSGYVQTEQAKEKLRVEKSGKKRPEISGSNHYFVKYPDKKAIISERLSKRNSERRGEKSPLYGKKRPDFSFALSGGKNVNARCVYVPELNKKFDTIVEASMALGISYSGMKYRLRKNPEKYEVKA